MQVTDLMQQKAIQFDPKLEEEGSRVEEFLINEGAVRKSKTHIGGYRNIWQIVDGAKILYSRWPLIKRYMIYRMKIHLAYKQGKGNGHYIGWIGEEITNDLSKNKMAAGWIRVLDATNKQLAKASPEEWEWIKDRDPNFMIEVKDAEKYNRAA